MRDIINGVASEYQIPREPRFYSDDNKLPRTNCNIPMKNVKSPSSNGARVCLNCNKEDVCMYKETFIKAAQDIIKISDRENVFMDIDIRCKKWSRAIANTRGLEI